MARKFMNQSEFAKHWGVARATVTEYKKKGLLVFDNDGRVDVLATEQSLNKNLDPLRGGDRSRDQKPAASDTGELLRVRINEVAVRTAKQALLLEKDAGLLIEKEPAARAVFTLSRQALESMLAIPDRLSSLLAVETDDAKVHEMLTTEIRVVANTLADKAEALFSE